MHFTLHKNSSSRSTVTDCPPEEDNHGLESRSSSMVELKKFFKPSFFKRIGSGEASLDDESIDEILLNKHGYIMGKLLGSGAGGSVRTVTRVKDNALLACKEFRAKYNNEQERDYIKKCKIEYSIGHNLNHQNVIKTLDFIHIENHSHFYEIMEYCPFDFFALVMKGNLKRLEINCYFKQLCAGVEYLHSLGIAHRDLKLDNCVVTNEGILKIVDFGSAVVFKSHEKNKEKTLKIKKAIVGSDPYMAPEVYIPPTEEKYKYYDPQMLDIWSIAIIYCCMTIKRFPWKSPRDTDKSFFLYSLPDDKPHDYVKAAKIHQDLINKRRDVRVRQGSPTSSDLDVREATEAVSNINIDESRRSSKNSSTDDLKANLAADEVQNASPDRKEQEQEQEHENGDHIHSAIKKLEDKSQKRYSDSHKVHGPYRLMRLLPHSARPIISEMLKINPLERATFDVINNDEWFKDIKRCELLESGEGEYVKTYHPHHFVNENHAHLQSYKEN